MIKLSRRRWAILSIAIVAAIVVGLLLPTLVGSGGPIMHWTCGTGPTVSRELEWIPIVLINAPYGGNATGNGSLPTGFLGPYMNLPSATGTNAMNGTVAGVLWHLWVNVSSTQNELTWGAGSNERCSQPFSVTLRPTTSQPPESYAGGLIDRALKSDAGEPQIYDPFPSPDLSNGFTSANSEEISTCGGPAQSLHIPLEFDPVTVGVWFDYNGVNTTTPFVLPLTQSYHYAFPANFGTWQVDNLSAPGGPGGGWAFDYTPCP